MIYMRQKYGCTCLKTDICGQIWTDMDRYVQLQPLFWPKFLPTKQKSQMIILRLAVLVLHATSIHSSAEVYSYSQPHVLSRLNVLRALKESMSQMPVPCQNPRGNGDEMVKSVVEMWSFSCRIAEMLGEMAGRRVLNLVLFTNLMMYMI